MYDAMQAFCALLIDGAMYNSMQQREKLVDILLKKDGSAILKVLQILRDRECGYVELVDGLFADMDIYSYCRRKCVPSQQLKVS